jgi:hypothetical protein
MRKEIKIVYQHYIPSDLIAQAEQLGFGLQPDDKFVKEKQDQTRYSNFTGPEIADIIIYIQQHPTELIAGGLLINFTYDILKNSIVFLLTSLSKIATKKLKTDGKQVDNPKRISLRLSNGEKEVEIDFDGEFDKAQADKIIDEAFKFINSDKLSETFSNPAYISNVKAKPKIRLVYNKEKQIWEPENFGNFRKQMEDYEKCINKNLRS